MISQNSSVRHQIREGLLPLAVIFLVSRLVLLAIATLASHSIGIYMGVPDAPILCRWDCDWYLNIAKYGYSPFEMHMPGETNFAFSPLFPMLVRLSLPLFGGNALVAGVAVANLCFFAALVYIYLYVRDMGLDKTVALLSVLILCIFPQSISFSVPYSESTALLMLAAAIYHLRRGHYLMAGIAAALLSAARLNGALFILFAIVWIWQKDGFRTLLMPWRAPEKFVPVVLAPLGIFIFFGYSFLVTGDAFAYSSAQFTGWGWSFAPPWETLPQQLHSGGNFTIDALVSISVALCSLLLLQYRMYAEFAFCFAVVVMVWCGQGMVSMFRFWLILFPIWVGLARTFAQRPVGAALLCASLATINGLMVCAWALDSNLSI